MYVAKIKILMFTGRLLRKHSLSHFFKRQGAWALKYEPPSWKFAGIVRVLLFCLLLCYLGSKSDSTVGIYRDGLAAQMWEEKGIVLPKKLSINTCLQKNLAILYYAVQSTMLY